MDGFIPRVVPERSVAEPHVPARRPSKDKHKQDGEGKPSTPFPLPNPAAESASHEEHPAPRSPHEEGVGDKLDITA